MASDIFVKIYRWPPNGADNSMAAELQQKLDDDGIMKNEVVHITCEVIMGMITYTVFHS